MISQLAAPSVCVIDDEKDDYEPILKALNDLYVSAVHILGSDIEKLPPAPFKRLRLVFLDLHLTASMGKDAASHTAKVFTRVVSPDTAPIVVVIWSKYAADKVDVAGVPPEDQETEAQLFQRTLLEAEPKFKGRVVFLEMSKPKADRPEEEALWVEQLKTEIEAALQGQPAVEVLWTWDSLVKDACTAVSEGLTTVAQATNDGAEGRLGDALKATLQRLALAQGEGDLSKHTAPGHVVAVLSELLTDQLEHPDGVALLAPHGEWLSEGARHPADALSARMNGFLLTCGATTGAAPFIPGTVYRGLKTREFCRLFGATPSQLINSFNKYQTKPKPPGEKTWRAGAPTNRIANLLEWRKAATPVAIELSPVCDVAQRKRHTCILVAGLLVPQAKADEFAKGDSLQGFAPFFLRWKTDGFDEQDVALVVGHSFRAAIAAQSVPDWLEPWFRLRELPTTAIRNQQAAHTARVGYVSL